LHALRIRTFAHCKSNKIFELDVAEGGFEKVRFRLIFQKRNEQFEGVGRREVRANQQPDK
jgi:hypothetical protein